MAEKNIICLDQLFLYSFFRPQLPAHVTPKLETLGYSLFMVHCHYPSFSPDNGLMGPLNPKHRLYLSLHYVFSVPAATSSVDPHVASFSLEKKRKMERSVIDLCLWYATRTCESHHKLRHWNEERLLRTLVLTKNDKSGRIFLLARLSTRISIDATVLIHR